MTDVFRNYEQIKNICFMWNIVEHKLNDIVFSKISARNLWNIKFNTKYSETSNNLNKTSVDCIIDTISEIVDN